jgi:hypothetical protein
MTIGKVLWITGGVIAASVLDLVYTFWSRSQPGGILNRAIWNSSNLGRGRFNVMNIAKHVAYKGKP